MTRQEFIDTVNEWWELKNFCSDNDCDVCDDIYDDSGMDEELDYCVREYGGDYAWYELRDMLDDIPSGYDYYRQNGSFDYDGMDDGDDFRDYKNAVLEWMNDGGYWDDDDEDFEEDSEPYDEAQFCDNSFDEEEEEQKPADEDFSVGDLIGMCSASFITIQQDNLQRESEQNAAFRKFVGANMPKALR